MVWEMAGEPALRQAGNLYLVGTAVQREILLAHARASVPQEDGAFGTTGKEAGRRGFSKFRR